jgi:hypothetical protein
VTRAMREARGLVIARLINLRRHPREGGDPYTGGL